MKLADYAQGLAFDIAFWLQGVADPAYPLAEVGKLSLEVSEKFRALGIILLLVHGGSDGFYHNLIRSARTREAYLQRLSQEGVTDDHHQVSGRYEPLLDAVAAGEADLASRIAALCPRDFREGHEYEDDYCYAQILHRLIQEPCPEGEIPPLLTRFEAYLAGQTSARFDVVKALAGRSQQDFDEAFDALLGERDAQIKKEKARGKLEEAPLVAQRQVYVEGLALLRLAERRGLATEPEYGYCPALARVPMVLPFPGE